MLALALPRRKSSPSPPVRSSTSVATSSNTLIPRASAKVSLRVAPGGDAYIADTCNHRIRKVSSTGIISTYAGTGVRGFAGDGGPALAAWLNGPWGLALDAAGNRLASTAAIRPLAAD